MANLLSRFVGTGFDAIKPVPNLLGLDGECDQLVGGVGVLNGNTTGKKLLIKTSDATDPPIECDQVGAGPLAEWKQNGTLKADIANDGVLTLTAIPVGPASNPTTDNQLPRKKYVDDRKVSFIAGFSIVDPAGANTNVHEFGSLVIPGGGVYTITKLKLMFRDGSHTAGAGNVLTFTFDRSGVGDIGTLSLNDTNNAAGAVYVNDIGDITPAENEVFSVRLTTKTGTITEKGVMAMIEGFRTAFN